MEALNSLLDGLIREIVNPLIFLFIGIAVVVFIYGVLEFVGMFSKGEEVRASGRRHMLWGIVGLAIMVGVFGILAIVLNTFGLSLDR